MLLPMYGPDFPGSQLSQTSQLEKLDWQTVTCHLRPSGFPDEVSTPPPTLRSSFPDCGSITRLIIKLQEATTTAASSCSPRENKKWEALLLLRLREQCGIGAREKSPRFSSCFRNMSKIWKPQRWEVVWTCCSRVMEKVGAERLLMVHIFSIDYFT